ncbi:MAG: NAD-dependent epimerase/dehydratase family protein [Deltaproteobacteria bacterium]|nr:MAG: NAD-dependent epimerase/dehydratase family protein [Deltaproteobacteria bacterium]
MTEAVTLIVGADSMIGQGLWSLLHCAGVRVAGTTRRPRPKEVPLVHLDLAKDLRNWRCPWPVAVAVICAGATRIDACQQDPEATALINVQGVITLIKCLVEEGVFVIYLSSNQVFDGSLPQRRPDEATCPITEYGRQKAEVERRLQDFGDQVAVMRLTKVLGPRPSLLTDWAQTLKEGRPIKAFADMGLAPIPLFCVVSALRLVADQRLPGILQISSQQDISYAEAAYYGAQVLGADRRLVQPVMASKSANYPYPVPTYSSLNSDRLRLALGITAPDVRQTLELAFTNPGLLAGGED